MSFSLKIVTIFCCLQFSLKGQDVTPIFQTGHFSKVNNLQFDQVNQHLVSASDDGQIIVWDINLGLRRSAVLAHKGGVLDFDFLNDSTIISLGSNNIIKTWSFPNLTFQKKFTIEIDSIQAFATIRDNKICVVGKGVHFYSFENNGLQTTQYQSKWLFQSVDFHTQRNEIIVTGSRDNYAVTIDLKDPIVFEKYFIGNIHKAKYASSVILLATTDGSLQYRKNGVKKKQVYTLIDDLNYVTDMDANSADIAIGTAFGFTTVFSSDNQDIITNIGFNGNAISTLQFSENGKWLAIGNTKGTVYLYDTDNYNINKILKGASAGITDLKVIDKQMVVGYSDGIIRHINLASNQIKSNSIRLDLAEEQNGINYAVSSIDTIIDDIVFFTVLKTNRHHIKTSLITNAKKLQGEWKLATNLITLKKEYSTSSLKNQVDNNYEKAIPFVFSDYSNFQTEYSFGNAKYSISAVDFNFSKVKGKDTIVYKIKHTAPVSGLQFLSAYNLLLSYSKDGSIRFWNTKGDYLAVFYLSGQYNFFYQNASNFYFASKEILDKIGFLYQNKLFSYEQYDVFYNRPAEVMNDLPYFEEEDISDYQQAYFKRLQKLGVLVNQLEVSSTLPQIDIGYFGEYSVKKEVVNFSLTLEDTQDKLVALAYLNNGIEKRIDFTAYVHDTIVNVDIVLAAGINQIEFYCVNEGGVRSLIKKKVITCEKNFEKPDLYLVTIGVSEYQSKDFNLRYARHDAEEINDLMSNTKAYSNILSRGFYDTTFTKSSALAMNNFLQKAKINDVIIFYFAGHGVLDDDFNYFLATYDMDFTKPAQKGLSFDALENMFEDLKCRNKLMMIDACFSGEIDKTSVAKGSKVIESGDDIQFRSTQSAAIDDNGDMGIFELAKRVFTDFKVSKGTNILSSSSGIEYSLEGEKWGNGLFTYVLKEGLANDAADLNDDNQIRILELQVYLRETVSALSNGDQNPILRKENIKNNFVIW